jgi:hypothetical protein
MSVPGLRREDFAVLDRLTYLNTASAGLVRASVVTPAHVFELKLAVDLTSLTLRANSATLVAPGRHG